MSSSFSQGRSVWSSFARAGGLLQEEEEEEYVMMFEDNKRRFQIFSSDEI